MTMTATEVDNVLIETLRRHFCQTEKFTLGAEWFGERTRMYIRHGGLSCSTNIHLVYTFRLCARL